MSALPEILLDYQRETLQAIAKHKVVVVEKSRRIGLTWGVAADAVLTAGAKREAGGQDVFYLAYNLEMTREFIDTCAMWARAFGQVAESIEEVLFKEQNADGSERAIQAFRIRFASGFEILALCSAPRSLRGRQGKVIIDEAAFHDDLHELLKAAIALLMWGGSVIVISTHNGADNAFNELISECRAGKRPYHVATITLSDALSAGLYRRICLSTGQVWSAEAEAAWEAELRAQYGDAAAEELDCIPRQGGGRYLTRTLLEARSVDVPIVRWTAPDGFVDLPEDERVTAVAIWCDENLAPLLTQLTVESDDDVRSFLGEDFARSGDLSVYWPLVVDARLQRHTPFIVELRNMPFRAQEQILYFVLDNLPRFSGAAFDATGNGAYLAEVARQKYGSDLIAEVKLSSDWYRDHMPKLKAGLEDATLDIPRDAAVIDDFRQLELVQGIARVRDARSKGQDGPRHGDAAIACGLAVFASFTIEGGSFELTVEGKRESLEAIAGTHDSRNFAGWID